MFMAWIDDDEKSWRFAHSANSREIALQLHELFACHRELFFCKTFASRGDPFFVALQCLHRLTNGSEVGQHSSKPPFAHIKLATFFGTLAHDQFGLLLSPDKEDR